MDVPRFIIIQYPGIVKNVDKAIVSLGGISRMSQDYYRNNSLSLSYQVDNLYSRPTIARKRPSTFVIIRVRRKKHADNTPSKSMSDIQVEILGVAKTSYHFNLMFDYQYLPVRRIPEKDETESQTDVDDSPSTSKTTSKSPQFECIVSKLHPQSLEDAMTWFSEENEQAVEDAGLFLIPTMFSKFFGTVPYVLSRETERLHAVPKNLPMGARLRPQRMSYALSVNFKDEKYPTEPDPRAMTKIEPILKENAKLGYLISQAFEKRPIWTRCSMLRETDCGESCLKVLLQGYAFYTMSGPFGRTWCKFGYDPRKDPESRPYQTVTYICKSPHIPTDDTLLKRRKKLTEEASKNKVCMEALFKFKPGLVPPFGQTFYHLCDIDLPVVHEILAGPPQTECHPVYGWLTEMQLDSIRVAMKAEIQKLAIETMQQSTTSSSGSERDSD